MKELNNSWGSKSEGLQSIPEESKPLKKAISQISENENKKNLNTSKMRFWENANEESNEDFKSVDSFTEGQKSDLDSEVSRECKK